MSGAAFIAADVMRGVRIAAVHGNAVRRRQQGRLRLRLFPGGLLRLRLGSGRFLLFLGRGVLLLLPVGNRKRGGLGPPLFSCAVFGFSRRS